MRYKLACFDFDGTLADSFPWFIETINSVAAVFRFKRVEPEDVDLLRGFGPRQIIQHLGIAWWKVPFIARHMRQRITSDAGRIVLFPGVDQMLRSLAEAGVELALVTSNSEVNARQVLGPEIAALFRYFECDAAMLGKAARFRRVLKRSGIPAQQAISIGDELRDLEAAARAGMPFGAVAWGFTHVDALRARAPAEVFTRVEQIPERLIAG